MATGSPIPARKMDDPHLPNNGAIQDGVTKNGRSTPVRTLRFGPKPATGGPIPARTMDDLTLHSAFVGTVMIRDLAEDPTAKRKGPDLDLFKVISTPLEVLSFNCVHYRTHNSIKLTYTFSSRNRFHK